MRTHAHSHTRTHTHAHADAISPITKMQKCTALTSRLASVASSLMAVAVLETAKKITVSYWDEMTWLKPRKCKNTSFAHPFSTPTYSCSQGGRGLLEPIPVVSRRRQAPPRAVIRPNANNHSHSHLNDSVEFWFPIHLTFIALDCESMSENPERTHARQLEWNKMWRNTHGLSRPCCTQLVTSVELFLTLNSCLF